MHCNSLRRRPRAAPHSGVNRKRATDIGRGAAYNITAIGLISRPTNAYLACVHGAFDFGFIRFILMSFEIRTNDVGCLLQKVFM